MLEARTVGITALTHVTGRRRARSGPGGSVSASARHRSPFAETVNRSPTLLVAQTQDRATS